MIDNCKKCCKLSDRLVLGIIWLENIRFTLLGLCLVCSGLHRALSTCFCITCKLQGLQGPATGFPLRQWFS